jgi:hypothetical protein
MPKVCRAILTALVALLIVQFASPASAQASRQTLSQVSQLILNAYKHLSQENDTDAARADCEKALALGKGTDDPFVSATIDVCFGDVADYEEKTDDACKRYDSALRKFQAVPAKHSAHRTLKTHISVTEGKRLTLGCET